MWSEEPHSVGAAHSLNAGFPRGYQSPSSGYLSGFLSPLSYEGQRYKKPFDFHVTLTDLHYMFDSVHRDQFNKLELDGRLWDLGLFF